RCKSSLSGPRDRTRLYAAAVTADPGPNFPGWSQVPDHRAIRCLNRAQRKALLVRGIARRGRHRRACLPTTNQQGYSNFETGAGQKSRLHRQVFVSLLHGSLMAAMGSNEQGAGILLPPIPRLVFIGDGPGTLAGGPAARWDAGPPGGSE